MFDLPHVASRLYETPLLIFQPKLESIRAVLEPRVTGEDMSKFSSPASNRLGLDITESGIAVLPVMGTLVRRTTAMTAACGMTSYHDIAEMAEEAFTNPSVTGVLLDIDSYGGEAAGLFDLVEQLRALADATKKPIWAVADEFALSAAYGIACAADKIWVPQTAEVGSVGVVALHVDESKADARAGLSYTYIHAGEQKVDGNPHEPLSDAARERLQKDVDGLYDQFTSLVANRRGLPVASIQATEAGIFRGGEAVAAGLADCVGPFRVAFQEMSTQIERKAARKGRVVLATINQQEEEGMSADLESGPEPVVAEAQPVQLETERLEVSEETINAAVAAESERCKEISEISLLAKRLGVDIDPCKAIGDNIAPDALRREVLERAAAKDSADVVAFTPAADADPGNDRLLKAMKKMYKEAK